MRRMKLSLYCDEIKEEKIRNTYLKDEKWSYIGILVVPEQTENEILQNLLNKRCGNPERNKTWGKCLTKCRYHDKNDKEVHYHALDSKDIYFIADRWIDFLLEDRQLIYFYILGINLQKLDESKFGPATSYKLHNRIYNRFFRTAIQKPLKSYFKSFDVICVKDVYHDNSTLEKDMWFPWHPIFFLENKEDKITFERKKITFIDSNHRITGNEKANFIQFIDLLLGCTMNCLHWSSKHKSKEKTALKALDLVERLITNPNNINSRYKYVGRQKIEFFPKYNIKGLAERDLEYKFKKLDSFYTNRELRIKRKESPVLF